MKEDVGLRERTFLRTQIRKREESGEKEGCQGAKDGEETRDIRRRRKREKKKSEGGGEKERSGK